MATEVTETRPCPGVGGGGQCTVFLIWKGVGGGDGKGDRGRFVIYALYILRAFIVPHLRTCTRIYAYPDCPQLHLNQILGRIPIRPTGVGDRGGYKIWAKSIFFFLQKKNIKRVERTGSSERWLKLGIGV